MPQHFHQQGHHLGGNGGVPAHLDGHLPEAWIEQGGELYLIVRPGSSAGMCTSCSQGLSASGNTRYVHVNSGVVFTQSQPWELADGPDSATTALAPSQLDMQEASREAPASNTPSTVGNYQGCENHYGRDFIPALPELPALGELPSGQDLTGLPEAWPNSDEGYRTGSTPRRDYVPEEDQGSMDSHQRKPERSVDPPPSLVDPIVDPPAKRRPRGRGSHRVQKPLHQKRKKPMPLRGAPERVEGVPPPVELITFFCLFCIATFTSKAVWNRHLQDCHIVPKKWTCKVDGCREVFSRKDNLRQHLNGQHRQSSPKWGDAFSGWVHESDPPATSRCGFCSKTFADWAEARNHYAREFKVNRKTMSQWKGDWGFPSEYMLHGATLPSERSQE